MAGPSGTLTAKTDLNIVNAALSMLAQSPISSFGQQVGTAQILQSSYNFSRDDLLRRQPWNFARKWVQLNQLAIALVNLDIVPEASGPGVITFTNAFQLPNDCLRVFRFSPKDAHWRIVGRNIHTDAIPAISPGPLLGLQPLGSDGTDNQPSSVTTAGATIVVGIEYIQQVIDPNLWDSTFTNCFIWKLAKELAFGVTGLMQAYQSAKAEFDDAMNTAATLNGIENWPDPYWNTDLTDVRYGYVGVSIQGY